MQLCWKQVLCVKIHLVILRDTQYPILQFFYVFLQGFAEGCPPLLCTFAADFAHQKLLMKFNHNTNELHSLLHQTFHRYAKGLSNAAGRICIATLTVTHGGNGHTRNQSFICKVLDTDILPGHFCNQLHSVDSHCYIILSLAYANNITLAKSNVKTKMLTFASFLLKTVVYYF